MLAISAISNRFCPENALLLLLCRVHTGRSTHQEVNAFIHDHHLDLDKLFSIIQYHRLIPVAYHAIIPCTIDEPFKERLKNETIVLTIQSTEQQNEALRLYDRIRAGGINIVPYKGPLFSYRYYGSTALRQSTDIDFLLPHENYNNLERIIDILAADGYTPMYKVPQGYRELLFRNTCEFYFDKYRNGERTQHIEFHWSAHHPVFDLPFNIPNNVLLRETETINISGRNIQVLTAENDLLAILIHHGIKENWSFLKHVLDIAMLAGNSNVRWEYLRATCRKYHVEKALDIGLALSKELLGVQQVQSPSKEINAGGFIDNIFSEKKQRNALVFQQWRKIKILDSHWARLKLVAKQLKYIFSPSLLDYKFVSFPKPLHFLYLPVKILRMLIALPGRKV
jgi:hypothetical protein